MATIDHTRKTVYHSDLRSACEAAEKARIRIRLLGKRSRVLDSQYKNKGPYAPFVVDGEDLEREYQVENDQIRAALDAAPAEEVVWIRAWGGPGHEEVRLWLADGTPVVPGEAPAEPERAPEPEPAAAPPARSQAGPGAPSANGNGHGSRNSHAPRGDDRGTIEEELWASLLVAHRMVEKYTERFGHAPTEEVRSIAATVFIERNRSAGRMVLTKKMPDADELKPLVRSARRRDAVGAMVDAAAAAAQKAPSVFDDDNTRF